MQRVFEIPKFKKIENNRIRKFLDVQKMQLYGKRIKYPLKTKEYPLYSLENSKI